MTQKTDSLAALHPCPNLADGYGEFLDALWHEDNLPRRILALGSYRIGAIHACEPYWPTNIPEVQLTKEDKQALSQGLIDDFSDTEQAALMVAELLPFQHHEVSDDQIASLSAHLGQPATVTLLTALSFMDVNCRLQLVLE